MHSSIVFFVLLKGWNDDSKLLSNLKNQYFAMEITKGSCCFILYMSHICLFCDIEACSTLLHLKKTLSSFGFSITNYAHYSRWITNYTYESELERYPTALVKRLLNVSMQKRLDLSVNSTVLTECIHLSWIVQVLGNAKGAVAVVISILLFRNPVTFIGIAGYSLTVMGVIGYGEAKRRFSWSPHHLSSFLMY